MLIVGKIKDMFASI